MTTVTDSIEPPIHLNPREADPKRWAALAVIAVAQLMVVLDASIVTIALPSAQRSLHISTDNRQWMVTAYTLAFGGLLLLGGRIADYVGRKRMFIIGLLGFAAASALGGAAVNAPMLFGARALQGAMAALLAPAALSLITVTFTEVKERATAFGVYGAIAGRRCGHRPDHGRHPHPVRLMALVPPGQRPDRHRHRGLSRCRSSGRARPTATPATTFPVRSRSPPAWSPWSTGSPRPPSTAGPPPARWRTSASPWCCWSPSWPSSSGPRTRSCRCGSCSTAPAVARS